MAWSIPKQTLTGLLSNSNLSGTIGIPSQQLAGNLLLAVPIQLNAGIGIPAQQISATLSNPPQLVGQIGIPAPGITGRLHYVFITRRRLAATWYLTQPIRADHATPADLGIFAKSRQLSRWWLTRPFSRQAIAAHDLGIWAKPRLRARYPLRLATQHGAHWRLPIGSAHQAPYGWRESAAHGGIYAMTHPVACQHAGRYRLQTGTPVSAMHSASAEIRLARQHGAPLHPSPYLQAVHQSHWQTCAPCPSQLAIRFALRDGLHQQHAAGHSLRSADRQCLAHTSRYGLRCAAEHGARWEAMAHSPAALASDYALRPFISVRHGECHALTERVSSDIAIHFDLALLNPVARQHRSLFEPQQSQLQQQSPLARLWHAGEWLDVLSASISSDEHSPYWLARIELAELQAMQRLQLGDAVELQLGDCHYALRVDSRSLSRPAPAEVTLTLNAISPLAWLAPPHAATLTRQWNDPVWASAAVAALLPGIRLDWQLCDWLIPAGRLAASAANPVELAMTIAQAAGGLLESQADGSVRVRHGFPVSIPHYPTAQADRLLDEVQHVFELSEADELRAGSNRLRISDGQQTAGQDQLVFAADPSDPLAGTLRVVPAPWRDVSLAHSGDARVQIQPQGVVEREESELIEFKAGQASCSYPIVRLLSLDWHYADLGPVTTAAGSSSLQADGGGYSLARVRYLTRAIEFRIQHEQPDTIQFLLLE
ncbi:MAG: hypothetical protein U1F63_07160 [Chitinivorax sp.]